MSDIWIKLVRERKRGRKADERILTVFDEDFQHVQHVKFHLNKKGKRTGYLLVKPETAHRLHYYFF